MPTVKIINRECDKRQTMKDMRSGDYAIIRDMNFHETIVRRMGDTVFSLASGNWWVLPTYGHLRIEIFSPGTIIQIEV